MRIPEKRKAVMSRSKELGHCICNPKQSCPCDVLLQNDLCPCAGERPDPSPEKIRLTELVRKAGCASKISQADLLRVLHNLPVYEDPNVLVGIAAGDDAGVYKLEGDFNLVQTVDVFSPVVDDPYTYGQICAANSLSDIYAMGARPICALSIIGFPIETLPHEIMTEILRGGMDAMHEAGVSIIGGHSINDEEIKCGFAVTGLIRGTGSITNAGAQVGDVLVLTKPIGTGLISFGNQIKRISGDAMEQISRSMATLNKDAAELMQKYGAHACTDVTGFSLLGHLAKMVKASGVSAEVDLEKIPVFTAALHCVKNHIIPGAVERNRESFEEGVISSGNGDTNQLSLLYDAQTSGGLLISLPEESVDSYIEEMKALGHEAVARIGMIVSKETYDVKVILNEPCNLIGTFHDLKPASPIIESCCANPPILEEKRMSLSKNPKTEVMNEAPAAATAEAFTTFMKSANSPGLVDAKTKKLLAIALSIAQHCEPCLKIHLESALALGMKIEEIDEAAWMAIAFCGAPAKMFYERIKKEIEK